MNELHLFAGAGGGILGSELLGFRTVCAVELEPWSASVLLARQNDGLLPTFPVWDDVRTFDGRPWRGLVDVVSGGFPCQDISAAGKGAGIDGAAPASGGKCTELSMKYDRNSHSWKTHLCLWDEDLPESSVTLPKSGTMRNGLCWELTPLDYPITAPDYGFLPTPRACIGTHGIAWSRAEQGNHKCNLEDYLAYLYVRSGGKRVRGMCVSAFFVALMMGWPQKWTSLKPLATGKFLQWRQLHSGFFSVDSNVERRSYERLDRE